MKLRILVLCIFLCQFSFGQEFQLAPENSTELAIDGTSTLHGWTATAGEIAGVPQSISIEEGTIKVDPFSIVTQVMSLDGGRGPAMNGKIQKALKSDTNPEVIFSIEEGLSIQLTDIPEDGFPVRGKLIIAGISHEVELLTSISQENNTLSISGKRDMKMSDFEIEPPSAMFGQIKTNDDITIRFTVSYISN